LAVEVQVVVKVMDQETMQMQEVLEEVVEQILDVEVQEQHVKEVQVERELVLVLLRQVKQVVEVEVRVL
tara:strand:+ start:343 stop:549 length:207 start_codon:yes stop_codon:yes gene_type:complete